MIGVFDSGIGGLSGLQACDGLADAIERSALSQDATEMIAARARNTWAMGRFDS
jgi:glutamate racemase